MQKITVQLSVAQLETVRDAVERRISEIDIHERANPNRRGNKISPLVMREFFEERELLRRARNAMNDELNNIDDDGTPIGR